MLDSKNGWDSVTHYISTVLKIKKQEKIRKMRESV